jgi:PKD repeat protein
MGRRLRVAFVAALTIFSLTGTEGLSNADNGLPPLDPSKVDYTPIGYYGPPDETLTPGSATIPVPGAVPAVGPNPSGKWVPYDTNVWESLALPSRHPGDNCNSLAPDQQHPDCREGDKDVDNDGPQGYNGPSGASVVHGECPPSPGFIAGECFNSQLEYLNYYEQSMKDLLKDFGGVVYRYGFQSPGGGLPRGTYLAASGGQAYNIGAVVPGADHPEQTVLVSGHYDFTDSGPAAAWDSAEGHTEVMRMAYIMADYWRKTGTRPSATVKFIPWDSEESGTFGSQDYVDNNIPPGEEDKVRGYFNVDPCAGAYPAFKDGNFTERVPQVMQLANPDEQSDPAVKARMQAFNQKAEIVVDQVMDRLDDTITTPTGEREIFVSDAEATAGANGGDSQRDEIVTAVGGLALFTSDYANFEAAGIPIFNFFPDYFGPHADGTPASTEGISILHTPNDNLTRINKLTSGLTSPGSAPDATGLFASEGWAKGMEFCSQVEAWYMLQPEMAGAQTRNTNAVAYYEALPNEALQNQNVMFDASGSYQYADATTRELVPDSGLTFSWNFGDGNTATGMTVQHAYADVGRYTTTLTVTGVGGSTDTMTIPVEVIPSNFVGPELNLIDQTDAADGSFALNWNFTANRDGFQQFRVEESTNIVNLFSDDMENIEANWTVGQPTNIKIEEWQASDSLTPKFRQDNPHRSGDRSAWTGESPPFLQGVVVQGNSTLTMKNAITVPTTGDPALDFFYLFQNEGDDQGRTEVALVDDQGNAEEFKAVDVLQATMTAVGQTDPLVCDPSNPDNLTRPLVARRVDLSKFKGQSILIRFNYQLGGENRALSQPCGWHIDDVRMTSGTFQSIDTTGQQTFQIECKPNGAYGYRVLGEYEDGVVTAVSNVETTDVTNAPKPDLTLSSSDITSSKQTIRGGDRVTLTARIRNIVTDGCAGVANVKVRFTDNGVQIGSVQTIASIPAGGNGTASVVWDTKHSSGQRTVTVVADPGNAILEMNEANNSASRAFTVLGNKTRPK